MVAMNQIPQYIQMGFQNDLKEYRDFAKHMYLERTNPNYSSSSSSSSSSSASSMSSALALAKLSPDQIKNRRNAMKRVVLFIRSMGEIFDGSFYFIRELMKEEETCVVSILDYGLEASNAIATVLYSKLTPAAFHQCGSLGTCINGCFVSHHVLRV
jgi:hypothetical protein